MPRHNALSDGDLLALLRTEQDRLPLEAAQEILNRMDRLEEPLAALLSSDAAWLDSGPAWWAPLHATKLLAASGRASAFESVLAAIRRAHAEQREWILLGSTALLSAFGAGCAGSLTIVAEDSAESKALRIDALETLALLAVRGELPVDGVVRVAAALVRNEGVDAADALSPGGCAALILAHWICKDREKEVLAALGLDRRSAQRTYPGIWTLAKRGDVDVEDLFGSGPLLGWYSPEAIERRAERGSPRTFSDLMKARQWTEKPELRPFHDDLRLRPAAKTGRNDPCPCGSGKKFKKCCEGKKPVERDPRLDFALGRPVDDGMRDIRELFKLGLVNSTEDLNRLVVGKTTDEIRAMVQAHKPKAGPVPRVAKPEPAGTGHFDIEVSLHDIDPRIWRRFLLSDSATFLDLHDAIQDAGAWSDDHMFAFRTTDGSATVAEDPRGDGRPPADRVRLRDVFDPAAPTDLLYEYDFGDSWEVDLRCHGLVRESEPFERRLTGGARAFPAEDCGGVGGYEECVEAFAAKKPDADQRERLEWLGKWSPETFDLEQVSRRFNRPGR
jgi:hypothetical protein